MGDVYFELLAEDFKQRGLSDWALASKLIASNKEYASAGDPSVTSKIKYLKAHSYKGQLRAEAYEAIRSGASTTGTTKEPSDAYMISQGISTTTITEIPQQRQGSTLGNINVNITPQQDQGLLIGSAGTGGNIEFLKAGEYSTSGRGYYAPMSSKPIDWARAIDKGSSLSSGLSQVGGFKTSPIKYREVEPQGVYEFNVEQLAKAQYLDYTVTKFQTNPTSFRGMKGYSEVTTETGTTYSLTSDYFNFNFPSNKAYATYSREQFNKLPENIRIKSYISEFGFGTSKAGFETKVGLRNIFTQAISSGVRFDEKGNKIKNIIPVSSYERSYLETPQVTNVPVSPYGLTKASLIWAGGVSAGVGLTTNIKAFGFTRGIKESFLQLSPIRPAQNTFYPNIKTELLGRYNTFELRSGQSTFSRTTATSKQLLPTSDLFNAPRGFNIKIEQVQATTGNVGAFRQTTNIPYVQYAGGEFSFGRTISTTTDTVNYYPSKFMGGTTSEITTLKNFQTIESFRSNTPTNIKGITNFRYVSGKEITGFKPNYNTKTYQFEQGVNIDVAGTGTSFNIKGLTSSDTSFKMFSGGGTKTSLTTTFEPVTPTITLQQPQTTISTAKFDSASVSGLFTSRSNIQNRYSSSSLIVPILKDQIFETQKEKTDQGTITITSSSNLNRFSLITPTVTTTVPTQRITPIIIQPEINIPRSTTKQITKTITTPSQSFNYGDYSYFNFKSGGLTTPPITFGSFAGFGLGSRQLTGGRRVTGYAPSFSALIFKIRGSARKDITGIGLRPIPRNFSFTKRRRFNDLF